MDIVFQRAGRILCLKYKIHPKDAFIFGNLVFGNLDSSKSSRRFEAKDPHGSSENPLRPKK